MGERPGRKPQGTKLIDGLVGGERDKERVKVFLRTLSGECTVDEACAQLGIGATWFFDLRNRWLQDSLDALTRPMGRPPEGPTVDEAEVAQLRRQVRELEERLHVAELRESLHEAAGTDGRPSQRKKGVPAERLPRRTK